RFAARDGGRQRRLRQPAAAHIPRRPRGCGPLQLQHRCAVHALGAPCPGRGNQESDPVVQSNVGRLAMATMYEISGPIYIRRLNGLAGCLKKAQAAYAEKKYDEGTLLNYRFYPDMFSFARQVQQATDHARNSTALLAGVEAPKAENTEKSLSELVARVENT